MYACKLRNALFMRMYIVDIRFYQVCFLRLTFTLIF